MSKAFTMIETILALLIVSLSSLMYISFVSVLNPMHYDENMTSDLVSLNQMRLIFALSRDFEMYDDELYMLYLGKEASFRVYEDKIIMQDGYQVFYDNLDEALFYEDDECVFLSYRRKEKEQVKMIGCY